MNKLEIPTIDEFLAEHDLVVNYYDILQNMHHSVVRGNSFYNITLSGAMAGERANRIRKKFTAKGFAVKIENSTKVLDMHKAAERIVEVSISWE